MSTTVAQMTVEELKALVRDTVKETLLEILRDPDAGLELRPEFQSRLRASQAYVESGGKLISWDDMLHCLDSK
jgi:hypothetical protein